MGYTKFGEMMRILRIKNRENMVDTAELLGVRVPFVSAVENGKRNVPKEWLPVIINHYKLDKKEQEELYNAVESSKTQMKLNLTSTSDIQRKLAIQFQRSFENIDEDTAERIIKLLNKEKK